jgi:SM-20-related protein
LCFRQVRFHQSCSVRVAIEVGQCAPIAHPPLAIAPEQRQLRAKRRRFYAAFSTERRSSRRSRQQGLCNRAAKPSARAHRDQRLAVEPRWPQNRASPVAERTHLSNTAASLPPENPPDPAERIALTLAEQGWCVSDAFIPPLLTSQRRHEAETHWHQGAFRRAGVGGGNDRELRDEVRTDRVAWLDPLRLSGAQQLDWERLEAVRLAVNPTLSLGLYEFEAHLAVYPAGTYYRKHLDQFRGIAGRRLSCVLYLYPDWSEAEGGAPRIY